MELLQEGCLSQFEHKDYRFLRSIEEMTNKHQKMHDYIYNGECCMTTCNALVSILCILQVALASSLCILFTSTVVCKRLHAVTSCSLTFWAHAESQVH